ncbi:hypothetical protein CWE13_03100 [Aliidiomarina shirensis]|uniref:Uncharacterized protein n=1 Tax=Aliidiomarina shirensis TaxID=1048642 RepID=A0A432WXY0_9GAMM|nr:hypothetical protein [Aliidiomarina shirensis]RUO38648.1 hypothetical protein CWE13_03100 [Aliidiomarina shirensis]
MTDSSKKRDLLIQASIEAIPYIGGPLSTMYFGAKQEKRFERLESFYTEIKEEIERLKDVDLCIDGQNTDELVSLIEDLNEKVEQESREQKITYLKNFLISTLQNTLTGDFDQRKHYLDTLSSMSVLECEILACLFNQEQPVQIRQISKPGVSQYVVYSAISKIRSCGYLASRRGSYQMNGQQDEYLDDLVFLSDFGKEFCQYVKIA